MSISGPVGFGTTVSAYVAKSMIPLLVEDVLGVSHLYQTNIN